MRTTRALTGERPRGAARWRPGCLAFVLALLLPAHAFAQAPALLASWGGPGSGPGQFNGAYGVALDASGDVFVADFQNSRVQQFAADGTYLGQWPAYGFGVALTALGDVFLSGSVKLRKYSSSGSLLAEWNRPGSIGVTACANGNIIVTSNSDSVFVFGSGGALLAAWSLVPPLAPVGSPFGVAVDGAGNVFVVDKDHNRVEKFSSTGTFLLEWGSAGSGNGQFAMPFGAAVDAVGNVYVADTNNHRIQVFSGNGDYLTQWSAASNGTGQLDAPIGVAVDAVGDVYVSDYTKNRIQKFGPAPTPTRNASWGSVKARYR